MALPMPFPIVFIHTAVFMRNALQAFLRITLFNHKNIDKSMRLTLSFSILCDKLIAVTIGQAATEI